MIHIDHLQVRFDTFTAMDGPSLEGRAGELFGFLLFPPLWLASLASSLGLLSVAVLLVSVLLLAVSVRLWRRQGWRVA